MIFFEHPPLINTDIYAKDFPKKLLKNKIFPNICKNALKCQRGVAKPISMFKI